MTNPNEAPNASDNQLTEEQIETITNCAVSVVGHAVSLAADNGLTTADLMVMTGMVFVDTALSCYKHGDDTAAEDFADQVKQLTAAHISLRDNLNEILGDAAGHSKSALNNYALMTLMSMKEDLLAELASEETEAQETGHPAAAEA